MLNKTKRDPRRAAAAGMNKAHQARRPRGVNSAHRAYLAREARLDRMAAFCGAAILSTLALASLGLLWFFVALAFTF